MGKRRVCITGMGTVNPLALTREETWAKVLAGQTGIDTIASFDASTYASRVAGEVRNFSSFDHYTEKGAKKARHFDPFVHYAVASTHEALEHARLDLSKIDRTKAGITLGTGIGGMHVHTKQSGIFHSKGHRRLSPFYIPSLIGNMAAGFISIEYGLQGPNVSVQTACASANHALLLALMTIQNGMADVMLSGGSESIVEPMAMAGFCNMRALSTSYNDNPHTASRPFDKGRDGFVMGEGAGVFVLEELEFALARGVEPLCELVSVGMSGDAFDMVMPCTDGDGAYRSMKMACDLAGIDANSIDYINSHGTSTPLGDVAETTAIAKLLGNDEGEMGKLSASGTVHVGSTKSFTGHLIGAASAIEAVFSILAIRDEVVPANINLFDRDEAIPLGEKIINTEKVNKRVDTVLSNSFGFGGHNSSAIFRRLK